MSSPPGCPESCAEALTDPVAAAAGLELTIQTPLDVGSVISLLESEPESNVAIVPATERDRHPSGALLVVEMDATSVSIDLVRKARICATAGTPDYWAL